jgi:hypothetical protein
MRLQGELIFYAFPRLGQWSGSTRVKEEKMERPSVSRVRLRTCGVLFLLGSNRVSSATLTLVVGEKQVSHGMPCFLLRGELTPSPVIGMIVSSLALGGGIAAGVFGNPAL